MVLIQDISPGQLRRAQSEVSFPSALNFPSALCGQFEFSTVVTLDSLYSIDRFIAAEL